LTSASLWASKKRPYSNSTLGVRQVSNASSIMRIPRRWHTSITSGEGGLCAVRRALTPIAFMIRSWRRAAWRLVTAPSAPWSWWRLTPRSFIRCPLSEKPASGETSNQRIPKVVDTRSITRPRRMSRVCSV
jgi:hypothetical protein